MQQDSAGLELFTLQKKIVKKKKAWEKLVIISC